LEKRKSQAGAPQYFKAMHHRIRNKKGKLPMHQFSANSRHMKQTLAQFGFKH
jgi:hypothetical protein